VRYQPKTLLVTGGAGFIGSHFILYWLARYPTTRVINLDKLTYASNAEVLLPLQEQENYRFMQGDIGDEAMVSALLQEEAVDTIVHFAAESHVDRSIAGPDIFIQSNIVGTHNLLKCALAYWRNQNWGQDACRFHHISTDEVYGSLQHDDAPFTESSPYQPNSPYSASKAASDHVVRAYRETYQLPTTLSNCSNNYGPHQHAEKLIPTVIAALQKRQPIPVYGDGSNIRDWLYVEDHCQAIDVILHKGQVGQCYNVGGECEISNLSLVKHLCQHYDQMMGTTQSEQLIEFVTDRPGHDWRYAIDISKIGTQLVWRPQTVLSKGLERTIHYYVDPDL